MSRASSIQVLVWVLASATLGCDETSGSEPCVAVCADEQCGADDGCGGRCTNCPTGGTCDQTSWTCEVGCVADCTGRTCGDDDGCGDRCTNCPAGESCKPGSWTCEAQCTGSCAGKTCGDDDGCGTPCTNCPAGESCDQSTWTCTAPCMGSCEGKVCGDTDGCGDTCTACPEGQSCNESTGACETQCTGSCAGKTCGDDDGCGDTCTNCEAGQTCNQVLGQCEEEACSEDDDCPLGVCIDNIEQPYCSGPCRFDNECGSDQHCAFVPDNVALTGICVDNCTGNGDCTDPMVCVDGDADFTTECLPGDMNVGQACTGESQCPGIHCSAATALESFFPGGYCLASCIGNQPCPQSSHCLELTVQNTSVCARDCDDDSDCPRDGYDCLDLDGDGTKECLFAGPIGDRETGEACEFHEQCQAGLCLTASNFPGGYCSQLCENTACSAGSICYTDNPTPICFQECDGDLDCRTPEYTCQDLGLGHDGCFRAPTL